MSVVLRSLPLFPFSRLREKVADRPDEGVGQSIMGAAFAKRNKPSKLDSSYLQIRDLERHPHPPFGHLLPQAGEGESDRK